MMLVFENHPCLVRWFCDYFPIVVTLDRELDETEDYKNICYSLEPNMNKVYKFFEARANDLADSTLVYWDEWLEKNKNDAATLANNHWNAFFLPQTQSDFFGGKCPNHPVPSACGSNDILSHPGKQILAAKYWRNLANASFIKYTSNMVITRSGRVSMPVKKYF